MKRIVIVTLITALFSGATKAQELKCQVQVISQKVAENSGIDRRVFQTLQNSLTEFMNSRVWTQDAFSPEERIDCNVFINLESSPSQDVYQATLTIQSNRPVFNSNYNTPLFNFRDADFIFTYAENTPLEFNVNQYQSNLTSVLAYYAYLIIGMDYESFSKGGGQKYFTMAETINDQAPQSGAESKGWKQSDQNAISGNRNRYNLIKYLLSGKYEGFRGAVTEYHRNGMDLFYDDPVKARAGILNALDKLDKTFKDFPNNFLITLFFQAKGDELVNVFNGADQGEKVKAVGYLKRLDPANGPKYDKIIRG
ncbi:MAG: DUF4835 family protein [Chitinophagales bacterium]